MPFSSDQKDWGTTCTPHTLFPQRHLIKILSEKLTMYLNDYVFGGNVSPHSPCGKGCKLRILPIVLVIGKYTICFGGGGFSREKFCVWTKIYGWGFSG